MKIKKIWNLEIKIKIENQESFCKELKFENKRMKIKYKKYRIRNEK